MRATLLLLLSSVVWAQDNSLFSVLHGNLLEWDANTTQGQLSVRGADNNVQRCLFDEKSYFEKSGTKISATQLTKGLELEIVADRNGPQGRCYARAIRVTPPANPQTAAMRERQALLRSIPLSSYGYSSALESLLPRGNLTFAGVVTRLNGDSMVVHTRGNGDKSFNLRRDTRYLHGGSPTVSTALQVNDRVFIRAGKNFEDELEAFQVVWGEILRPME